MTETHKLMCKAANAPRLYGVPKIHKIGVPHYCVYRPTVLCIRQAHGRDLGESDIGKILCEQYKDYMDKTKRHNPRRGR